jgi:hypothetical protein
MNKYRIRFNKTRGQEGRGTVDHVWRVFENEKEYLFKHLKISGEINSEKDTNGVDYNIVCFGHMNIDRETSTATILCETICDKKELLKC